MSKELEFLSKMVAKGTVSRRDFLGRAAALGVAAPFATSLMSSAVQAAGPNKGGTLKLGVVGGGTTDSLDPATFTADMATAFGKSWGELLVTTNPDGSIQPMLAESFEGSADAKTWTFKLRQGVEFHNGKTLEAEDVVKTIQRHSGEETKSGAGGVVKNIESVKADGKDTVVITMKEGNADTPYLMADYHLIIQPNGGMDKPDAGIGTGPYKVEVGDHGVRYAGTKFANHWNPEVGHADSIEFLLMADSTARMSALQSGQIHMMNRVEPKIVKLIERIPNVKVENTAGRGHYVFIMHCNTAPFDNQDLRLALKYAINREEMVKRILNGFGSVGNDMPINGAYSFFSGDIEQRSYDPDKASFHYKKSGHSGKVLLRTSDAAFPGAVDASILYQQSAAAAGIELEIQREPADGYWSNVWNAKPFCASYWGGRPVQDQMYSTAYLSDAPWNDTRFFNDKFDGLIKQARTELDAGKRTQLYKEAGMLVRDEGGLICPMFNDFIDAVSNDVGGFVRDPSGPSPLSNGYAAIRCWLKA